MADYNDGSWHGWNGGECPVHPETMVEVALENGIASGRATGWDWDSESDPIVAFRVVKEHQEPREFYLNIHSMNAVTKHDHTVWGSGWITVREVVE